MLYKGLHSPGHDNSKNKELAGFLSENYSWERAFKQVETNKHSLH